MIAAFIITLREALEAALLIGIVLAVLRRQGQGRSTGLVWAGAAAAAAVSVVAGAILMATGGELEGAAEQLFEAVVMATAAVLLTWMIFWMRRQARSLQSDLDGRVGTAIAAGGAALFWLTFTIVVREGLETALFLIAAASREQGLGELAGALAGLALAAALGYAAFRGGLRLDLRRLFAVLNVVLLGFAAYLVWGAVAELGELVGGEAAEVLGPLAAALYAGAMVWSYRRQSRRLRIQTGPAVPRAVRGRPGAE